jgi:hypothetical protein
MAFSGFQPGKSGDYNTLLAQMIAKSRPQTAPGGGRVGMLGGGGAPGLPSIHTASRSDFGTNIGVSIPGILSTLEALDLYQPPSTKRDLAKQGREMVELQMPPEKREGFYQLPEVQKELEKFKRSGSPHVYWDEGMQQNRYLPIRQEVQAKEMYGQAPQAFAAGAFGPEMAANFAKNIHAPNQWSIAPQEARQGILSETDYRKAAANHQQAVADTSRLLAGPQADSLSADAEYKRAAAKHQLAAAQAEKSPQDEKIADMLKNELSSAKAMDVATTRDIFAQQDPKMKGDMIQNYGNFVQRHIDSVKQLNKNDPSLATGAASSYNSMVSQQLQAIAPTKTSTYLGIGGPEQLSKNTEAGLRNHMTSIQGMRQKFGAVVDPNLEKQMIDNMANSFDRVHLAETDKPLVTLWLATALEAKDATGARKIVEVLKQKRPYWLPEISASIEERAKRTIKPKPPGAM